MVPSRGGLIISLPLEDNLMQVIIFSERQPSALTMNQKYSAHHENRQVNVSS